jgi:predicted transposase/invertase (TIGR01784 family)
MRTYDESLKVYWDNYSVLQTAKHEGREQGKRERDVEIAKEMKEAGEPVEKITRFTGLTQDQIKEL